MARMQFAANITFHILFPTITIGLGWVLLFFRLRWLKTHDAGTGAYVISEFVPGSHYSGRRPPKQEDPAFEGQGPISVLCKAGDIYFTNHQAWHRGAPNTSDRVRYVMQVQYAQRWTVARFGGMS